MDILQTKSSIAPCCARKMAAQCSSKTAKRSDYTEQKPNKFGLNRYYAFIVCFAHFHDSRQWLPFDGIHCRRAYNE